MKKWIIGKPDMSLAREISENGMYSQISSEVMASNGIQGKSDRDMFLGNYEDADPYGLLNPFDIPGMEKAVSVLEEYIDKGSRIIIYGDYDCDGIMSTASLYNYLVNIGADVGYFINMRSDGYGININNIKKLADEGAELIITVDNGISAVKEAEYCKERNVDLLITDHHIPPPEIPAARAVVDPHIMSEDNKCKFRDICGCEVVLKLITAMEGGESMLPLEMMSDFAAIATIGDVMPITGENRTIVKHGLHYIRNTENIGLKALIREMSVSNDGKVRDFVPGVKNIAFGIVPRINASGRLGSAMEACELFVTDDEERANEIARKLCELNTNRKTIEEEISENIENSFKKSPENFYYPVTVVSGKNWHKGVIGIDASRVLEATGKPTFIISVDDEGNATGSARAPEGFSVFDSLLDSAELLTKFGGHKGAGGFSLKEENINTFRKKLNEFSDTFFVPELKAVKTISSSEITVDNVKKLYDELSPFGEKNPEPVFCILNAVITSVYPLSDGKYTKVNIDFDSNKLSFPLFKTAFSDFPYLAGDKINIMANLRINEFNGKESVNLNVLDMRISGINQQKLLNGENCYKNIKIGKYPDDVRVLKAILPERKHFAQVYRLISPQKETSISFLAQKLCREMNMCMLNVIIDAFCETGLVSRNYINETVIRLPSEKGNKVNLSDTEIIKEIEGRIKNYAE